MTTSKTAAIIKKPFYYDRWMAPILIFVFIISGYASGAGHASGKSSETEEALNRLEVCIASRIVSLDPASYRDRTTQAVLKNIFDSLTTRDANMRVAPQLAESWKTIDDTTWEFKLKQGVRFHNGDEFTARDVKFSLERIVKEGAMEGETSPRKSLLAPLVEIKAIDKYTVRLLTEKPWPILPLMLTLQEMLPQNYIHSKGVKEFKKKPIGAGPFQFVRTTANGDLLLKRFDDYYGGSSANPPVQPAQVQYLAFKTVPLLADRIIRLKIKSADIIDGVSPVTVPVLHAIPGVRTIPSTPTRSYFADINCKKPLFSDVRMREALNFAIDKEAIIKHLLHGSGVILPTILLPHAFARHPILKPHPFDPENAKK